MKCNESNQVMASFGEIQKRFAKVDAIGDKRVCPGCGRTIKLRRHPSNPVYLVVPRHNKEKHGDCYGER